jgi:sugar O-acyltransferase (sialic acid O-acetyltransferase NeuD family)
MYELIAPQLNANETDITITEWMFTSGDAVSEGDVVCCIETTKSVLDLTVESSGFLFHRYEEGQEITVGTIIGWVFPTNDPGQVDKVLKASNVQDVPREFLITKKAKKLIQGHGLNIDDIPHEGIIGIEQVEAYLLWKSNFNLIDDIEPCENSILVYCAGQHAEVVHDIIEEQGEYKVIAFVDYGIEVKKYILNDLPVFHRSNLEEIFKVGVKYIHINTNDFITSFDIGTKAEKIGYQFPNIIHPKSSVSKTAKLGKNILVGPNVVIGTKAEIGDYTKILNCASVAHHSKVGNGCSVSDGARISGRVEIGDNTVIGLNVSVNNNVTIGNNVIVVSSANVTNNIQDYHIHRQSGEIINNKMKFNDNE